MTTISFCVPKKGFSDPHIQMRENGNNDRLLLGLCFHVIQIVYGKEQKWEKRKKKKVWVKLLGLSATLTFLKDPQKAEKCPVCVHAV